MLTGSLRAYIMCKIRLIITLIISTNEKKTRFGS